jgi:hypothetical protein
MPRKSGTKARRKQARQRGRPRQEFARRQQTTRAAMRGEPEAIDAGAPGLLQRKLALAGSVTAEMNASGILLGRGHIDADQFRKLTVLAAMLQQIRRSMGKTLSVGALWSALIDRSHARPTAPPLIGDGRARDRLTSICRQLNGSAVLVLAIAGEERIPALCIRAAANTLTAEDRAALNALRRDLDQLAIHGADP